ncbi:MAG TPA: sodium/solute symporter [Steroidobacteraceae bacterium]|nr:sodium/solute symporter [Steroidobacteraceae bacterium]
MDEAIAALPSGWDAAIVALYIPALVLFGARASRRQRHAEDYFLASRASGWPAIGLALLASNISSTALVGLAGAAFATGISVYDYEWSAAVVLVFFSVFLLPFLLSSRVYTMPEFLERRYDGRARLYFALLTLFLNVTVDAAAALYSGSLVIRVLFPGAPLWLIIGALAGGAGLYTVLGGLRAVIVTEVVQGVLLFLGAVVIALVAFSRAGGWHAVMASVPPAKLSLIRPLDDPAVPWLGLLLGIPLLGFYYWCTNQFIVQRVLSARTLEHGRGGALFAGLLKLPVLFFMVLPGTCAIVLFPHLTRPDLVYPSLVFGLLPAGLMGLVAASLAAATMASVASTLNSASALITMDIVRRSAPGLPDGRVVRIGRLSTAALLLVAMIWAPQLEHLPSLWQYLQAMLAYAAPPIIALFLVGLFWRGATASGAAVTLLAGTVCGIGLFLANIVFHLIHLHFLYVAPLLVLIDVAILIGVSLVSRRQGAPPDGVIWTTAYFRAETERLRGVPAWRNYRVQAAMLLILTAGVVIVFR